ncbi:MAG: tRNA (N6-isopentenyl adenosine(37)-C2)-methylthiotransferase MiaB [Candidatus Eremiobacteraeota bacterium]|nr:tRNA (N6-isopentenyl adenosine(37)-C2)-methylthiotransferase MiaB [Candidatus Eremiobacteraeota bacterium]MBV8654900.1 tRNA (N6-isopentenyl adenosine(37)-C2)-methylthiotransferase MiaB [Candidatus Eremiobacteraeota bacterium]
MPNIYIETFGCQMNEADSQYVADRAEAAGYAITSVPEEADVLLINTCTVRDNAERRAYGRMNHLKVLKDADPAVRLVVTGCLAEQDRDRMQKLAPHVDAIFGTKELVRLGDQLEAWQPSFSERVDFSADRALLAPLGGSADGVTDAFSHLRAFVNVQRGCSYYCTFCIVPHVRGRFDHRPIGDVVADVAEKIAGGAREVMLVGQTVNAWRDTVAGADFGDLCREVARLAGLERLTFISPHPKDFSEKIVADLGSLDCLNPRVHLPLQSASDAVLRRMNRKYTAEQYGQKVDLIRRYLPQAAITTDIIVGFPGETEADFEATLDYVATGIFANAFTFVYSMRRGTPAANWDQVPADVASARFARLVEAQNASTLAYHARKRGTIVRALVCGTSKKDASKLAAKALDNVTVIAPKPPDYDDALYAREPWLSVAIEESRIWGCTGTVVTRAHRFSENGVPVKSPALSLI